MFTTGPFLVMGKIGATELIVILLIVAAVYAVLSFYCGWCGK